MNLNQWSQSVVEAAQRNVGAFRTVNGRRRRIDSSGKLRNSLGYLVEKSDDGTVIKFQSDVDYAVYVEQGIRGAESSPIGTRNSPFSYGRKQPPVEPILKWMRAKPLRVRNLQTGQFVKATDKAKRGAAFAIARNIRKHGVEATHFMREAIDDKIEGLEEVFTEEIDVLIFERLK